MRTKSHLHSIAYSQGEVGEEVLLTVHHGQHYTGAASGYLGVRLTESDSVRVFIEPNANFRLAVDGTTPIIMIGAGTGIARPSAPSCRRAPPIVRWATTGSSLATANSPMTSSICVCGDAARMARDVEHVLMDAIARASDKCAEEYLDNLRAERRYQRDVY